MYWELMGGRPSADNVFDYGLSKVGSGSCSFRRTGIGARAAPLSVSAREGQCVPNVSDNPKYRLMIGPGGACLSV
jgi:hypothetical protein